MALRTRVLSVLLPAALVAGCSVAPPYDPPQLALPSAFKEAPQQPADPAAWKPAEPGDGQPRGAWWTIFDDPRLDALQREAVQANPTLQSGIARVEGSRALLRAAVAERFPRVDVGAGPTRERASPAALGLDEDADVPPRTLWRAVASADYEVDLFGRVRNAVAAARADAEQDAALLHSLQLAIQADVAQHYLLLRWIDTEIALLEDTAALRADAVDLIERRVREGEAGELDLARARTELSNARSDRIALTRTRAEVEHALAVLLGRAPAELTIAAEPTVFRPVTIPPGVPSTLLERRPDIAAAERAMAAANARIGVARAAYFPRLSLTGLLGFESGELGDLFRSASRTWALGPLVGTMLSMTVFDGGRREAIEASAAAEYDRAVADYRQTVLNALREVEDQLSGLRILAEQAREEMRALEAARRAAQLSSMRYREGYVSYFEVIDAERQVLAAQRAMLRTDRERALATVALVRALGGGWQRSEGMADAVGAAGAAGATGAIEAADAADATEPTDATSAADAAGAPGPLAGQDRRASAPATSEASAAR